jgi:hypothetical protein
VTLPTSKDDMMINFNLTVWNRWVSKTFSSPQFFSVLGKSADAKAFLEGVGNMTNLTNSSNLSNDLKSLSLMVVDMAQTPSSCKCNEKNG